MIKAIVIVWLLIGVINFTKFKLESGHRCETVIAELVTLVLAAITGPLVFLFKRF